jgi:hypothetical protein
MRGQIHGVALIAERVGDETTDSRIIVDYEYI